MRGSEVRRAAVQSLVAALIVVSLFFAYASIATHLGRSRAEAVCASVSVGMSADAAQEVLRAADPAVRQVSNGFLAVGFKGAFLDRWMCNLRTAGGRAVEREVRLVD